MDYFKEVIHLVYLAKQLYDIGKYDVIEHLQGDEILEDGDFIYDTVYDAAYSAICGVFEHTQNDYNDEKFIDVTVMSDKVIVDYFLLAGEYGKRNGLAEADNPYFREPIEEAQRWFYFSYSLAFQIKGFAKPNRPFKSKLVIGVYTDGECDPLGVAIGVAGMYKFFSDKCAELRELLSQATEQEAVAA